MRENDDLPPMEELRSRVTLPTGLTPEERQDAYWFQEFLVNSHINRVDTTFYSPTEWEAVLQRLPAYIKKDYLDLKAGVDVRKDTFDWHQRALDNSYRKYLYGEKGLKIYCWEKATTNNDIAFALLHEIHAHTTPDTIARMERHLNKSFVFTQLLGVLATTNTPEVPRPVIVNSKPRGQASK